MLQTETCHYTRRASTRDFTVTYCPNIYIIYTVPSALLQRRKGRKMRNTIKNTAAKVDSGLWSYLPLTWDLTSSIVWSNLNYHENFKNCNCLDPRPTTGGCSDPLLSVQTYCLLLIVSHGSGPFLLAHFWVKHQESNSMLLFCRKVWKLYNSVVHSLCCNPPLIIYLSSCIIL